MLEDSKRALALDSSSVKGAFMLGLGQLELGDDEVATKSLAKALELARESSSKEKERFCLRDTPTSSSLLPLRKTPPPSTLHAAPLLALFLLRFLPNILAREGC